MIDPYFMRFCMNQYHITRDELYRMDTGRCYMCNIEIISPRKVYLDHDRMRNLNNGFCCRNCYNIQREKYDMEEYELHNAVKHIFPGTVGNINDVWIRLSDPETEEQLIIICRERGYSFDSVKRHLKLLSLL